jgi:hypothetical protein
MWYFICLSIGACVGALVMGYLRGSSHDDDCKSCKSYYIGLLREKDDVIHGLKSTRGKLGQKIQSMTQELQTTAMDKNLVKP